MAGTTTTVVTHPATDADIQAASRRVRVLLMARGEATQDCIVAADRLTEVTAALASARVELARLLLNEQHGTAA